MNNFVVAECMVRQLHALYVDAVWRKDIEAFGDCFTEDCEWRIADHVLQGRGQIMKFMNLVFPMFRRILLTMRTPVLDVEGGTASSRTYFTENSVLADGQPMAAIGSYYERFVDEGDRWRFSWRVFQTEYAGAPDFSGPFYNNPDWGAPPAMPPLDTIPIDHSGAFSQLQMDD